MKEILIIAQVFITIFFMLSVLFQEKGSEMSLAFGGSGNNTFYGSKQGIDKVLAYASYVLGFLFLLNATLYIILID